MDGVEPRPKANAWSGWARTGLPAVMPVLSGGGAGWFFSFWARLSQGQVVATVPVWLPGDGWLVMAGALLAGLFWLWLVRAGVSRLNLTPAGAGLLAALCDTPLCLIPLGWLLFPTFQTLGRHVDLDILGRIQWPGLAGFMDLPPAQYLLLLWAGPWLVLSWFAKFILAGYLLVRRQRDRLLAGGWIKPFWLFAAAAVFYGGLALWTTTVIPPTGDEPHYLLMTHSLMHEQDLDLADNMARKDFQAFYPAPTLDFHSSQPDMPGAPLYSKHSSMLSFLLLPGYAVLGRFGAVLTMVLFAAGCAVLLFQLARRYGLNECQALAAWLIAVTCAPLAVYFDLIYTEVPASLVLLGGLLAWSRGGTRGAVIATLAACLLPWLYPKYVPLAAGLGILALWTNGIQWRDRVLVGGLTLVAASAYVAIYAFGPSGVPGHAFGVFRQPFSAQGLRNALGLLVDRDFGLLVASPALGLSVVGFMAVGQPFRRLARASLGLFALQFVFFTIFDDFTGSSAIFSRQMIPAALLVLPLAVLGRGQAWAAGRHWGSLADLMLVAGVGLAWLVSASPVLRYLSPKLKLWASLGFTPTFFPRLSGPLTVVDAVWAMAWVVLWVFFWIRLGRVRDVAQDA